MPKPKVGHVSGLSPAIAIEQKAHAGNPRSTVGTMTEIYDYLRILYARLGIPHSPETGEEIKSISKDFVVEKVLEYPEGEKIQILAPIEMRKNEKFEDIISRLLRKGYVRIRLNGEYYPLDQEDLAKNYDKKRKNELLLVVDRLVIKPSVRHRLFEAIEKAVEFGENKLVVAKEDKDVLFNLAFAVESTGKSYPEITPHTFGFNVAEGMCPECMGLGYQYGANLVQNPEIAQLSAAGLIRYLWQDKGNVEAMHHFEIFLKKESIDPHTPIKELPPKKNQILMNGSPPDSWYMSEYGYEFRWCGINTVLAKAGKNANSDIRDPIIPLLNELECNSCQGARINPLARNVTINKTAIHELCRLPIEKSLPFIEKLKISRKEQKILEEVQTQLLSRLKFLLEVGLGYISLDRKAPTLSGGEAQRIRLARQLGSGLTGVLYVLDEPTIGLHPRDNDRLNQALKQLKDLGNTMVMVEHDPLTVATADYILDFGPHGGDLGGHITAQGTYKQILRNKNSLTGSYLSGREAIPLPGTRRPTDKGMLTIENAKVHNLKNIDVEIPIGVLTCLTGVSGSGKSSLLQQLIQPAISRGLFTSNTIQLNDKGKVNGIENFDKMLIIDQNPIGHTSRSDVCTYVDVLTKMREFFASLPLARSKGLQPKHFSYNHRRGMCSHCWGMGYKKIEMSFLPPVKVVCEECQGLRLNPISLEVKYQGKNLGEYLQATVEEAQKVFINHPKVKRILDTLISVGLGYLKLGQEMASLSGGEAQRIKLSRELSKRSTGRTLYLLDEPTTGLHMDDIKKLLKVLHHLVDKGNTMIVIEHNMDFIKNGDYLIDLGPEAGNKGGEIVCTGTPEEVVKHPSSWTGKYLKPYLMLR
jgi:excinuclease ABC subunit A